VSTRPQAVTTPVVSFSTGLHTPGSHALAATTSQLLAVTVSFQSHPQSRHIQTQSCPREDAPAIHNDLINNNLALEEPLGNLADSPKPMHPIASAEAAGLVHVEQVMWSGEVFNEITADNWEDKEPPSSSDNEMPKNPLCQAQPPTSDLLQPASTTGTPMEPELTTDENNPDPFHYPPKTPHVLLTPTDIHPNCVVYIIYLLVL
jgi:hypothetical protein